MKIALLVTLIVFVGTGIISSSPQAHYEVYKSTVFQKREILELSRFENLFADKALTEADLEALFVGTAFNWEPRKAQYVIDEFRGAKLDARTRYFSSKDEQSALELAVTNVTKGSDGVFKLSVVAVLGLKILRLLEIFKEQDVFQDLSPEARYDLAFNWNEFYSVAWKGINEVQENTKTKEEVVRFLYNPVVSAPDAFRFERPLEDFAKSFLQSRDIIFHEIRLLANPESSYEYEKRRAELGDSFEPYRFFYSIGFLVLKRSDSLFCALPFIGQSADRNQQQVFYVGRAGSNIFSELTEEGADLEGSLISLGTFHRDYPEVYLSIPAGVEDSCHWSSIRPSSDDDDTMSRYRDETRLFDFHLIRNPVVGSVPRYALQVQQLPIFRRGLWQKCPHSEEKLWSFFGDLGSGEGVVFTGGQVAIERGEASQFYHIDRVFDARVVGPFLDGRIRLDQPLNLTLGFSFRPSAKVTSLQLNPVLSTPGLIPLFEPAEKVEN